MNKKPRYAVMLEGNKTIYRGNSRFVAWTLWLINRHRKAIAYDCGIWVVEPAYWIRVARTEKSANTPDSIKA
ncbi:hypothetical protein OOL41_004546 [Salmonella enterica]|uniref:hypothetical protein n=1 Tax=Escherichia coli TaxID=562 RepID=UPI00287677EF|nr:hypothetical protein [Escherichia coli]EKB5322542.1 hypothetical protein [Salmonella enterica]MDS0912227.1 hypothetical protein [Escherichia coli]